MGYITGIVTDYIHGYTIRHTGPECFEVFAPDGVRVQQPYKNMERAGACADRHYRNSKIRKRNCMTCSEPFKSFGPGNCMCAKCRTKSGGMI